MYTRMGKRQAVRVDGGLSDFLVASGKRCHGDTGTERWTTTAGQKSSS